MVGRKLIIITLVIIIFTSPIPPERSFSRLVQMVTRIIIFQWQCCIITRRISPGSRQLYFFGEFMHDNNIQFMPIVVTGRIAPAFIYFVKLAICPRQRIPDPSGCFSCLLTNHKLHSVSTPFTGSHLIFPWNGWRNQTITILIFQQVVHPFIITFNRKIQ